MSLCLEWQSHLFAKIDDALAADESTFVVNVGRQAGKTSALLLWALTWERGALFGGHIAFCAPSDKHLADIKDKLKRWAGELISGPSPAGLGWEFQSGGRIDFWPLGFGAIAAGRGRSYNAVLVDEGAYVPNLASIVEANLMPTLATTGGPVIVGSTPDGINNDYHDLWRHTPERARFSGGSDLNPAITDQWLANKRRSMIELRYLQEVEGVFCDVAGLKLKRSEVRYGQPPDLASFRTISMAIDPATSVKTSADYTAIAICGVDRQDRRWLLHLAHWRLSWGETETKLLGYYAAWRPHTVIFEAVNFAALGCRMLKARADIPAHFSPMTVNVKLRSESSIIKSIHASLSSGTADWAATLDQKGNVVFWKRCLGGKEYAVQHNNTPGVQQLAPGTL